MAGVMRWDKVIKDCGFVSVASNRLLRGGIRRSCYEDTQEVLWRDARGKVFGALLISNQQEFHN